MKNLLVMGSVGVALAGATVGGLLWAQGRLNYEGTRSIPILNTLFSSDEQASEEPITGKAPEQSAPRETGRSKTAGHKVSGVTTASSQQGASSPPRGTSQKSASPKTTGKPAKPSPLTGMPGARGFEAGELFDLEKLEATGLTVDDVNAIVEQARKERQRVAAERVELRRVRQELELRERDVADRYARVSELMAEVVAERKRVEQAIHAFNKRVTELHVDEIAALEATAGTIAKLEPSAGAELIVEFWLGENGPSKVVKILAVMDKDRADEILACLDTKRAREILERRMTVIRTGAARPASTRRAP